MQNLQNLWYKLTVTHADNVDEARREYMTKVILVILNMVGLLFLLVFAINWLVGTTSPTSLIVAVVMETLLGVSWWLAHSGYWQITSYLPPLMFLLLAGQLNYRYGPGAVAMLQYAIAVLLTAMLQGRSAQWITVILGIGAYLGIGSMHVQGRLSPLAVPETSFFEWAMPFSGMLVFIAILQWFYTTQFQQTVARSNAYAAEVIAANNRLEQEIIERKQVEEESIRLQQEIIQAQQRAIQELSTPVIPVMLGHRSFVPASGLASPTGHDQRISRHTTPTRDLPAQVRVTRQHHALEGKVLEVFAKLRHKGRPHFMLVLPDGTRSYVPVAWTDVVTVPQISVQPCSTAASASDLLRLRERVDCLLRRIEAGPTRDQNSPTQESQHATLAIGAVECRAASDSTAVSTAHAPATKQAGQPSGRAHSQAGAKPSQPSHFHPNQRS